MINYLPEYELYHHGIKGQKWGVRRFQNADGSLTRAGQLRLEVKDAKSRYNTYAGDTVARAYLTATPAGLSRKVRGKLVDSATDTNKAYQQYIEKKSQYKIEKKRESGAKESKLAKLEYKEGRKLAKLKADTELTNKANEVFKKTSTGRYVASMLLNGGMPSTIYALEQSGMSHKGAVTANLLLGNIGSKSLASYRVMNQAAKEYDRTHKKP